MRFEPIESYYNSYHSTMRSWAVDNLVDDFGIRSWAGVGANLYESLRCVRDGSARPRLHDHDADVRIAQAWYHIIDHAALFKGDAGVFLLTMPYETPNVFLRKFSEGMRNEIIGIDRFGCLDAHIIGYQYKTRTNGDFAAVIATRETLEVMRGLMRSY